METTLNQLYYEVTTVKINELQSRKALVQDHYDQVLRDVAAAHNLHAKVRLLYEGIHGSPLVEDRLSVDRAGSFVKSIHRDPSISPALLEHWQNVLLDQVHHSMEKCRYSCLLGFILQEELSTCKSPLFEASDFLMVKNDAAGPANEREKTIQELEKRVFRAGTVDTRAFREYLNRLFDMKDPNVKSAVNDSRLGTKNFCDHLLMDTIEPKEVKLCIEALLASNLIDGPKKEALQQLKDNPQYLQDLGTLLTNRLHAIDQWRWPAGDVYVDVRRSIQGRYRAFLEEEVSTALLLQYVGVRLSVHIRYNLTLLYESNVWKLNDMANEGIEEIRRSTHKGALLSMLPSTFAAQGTAAGVYDEASDSDCFCTTKRENNAVDVKNKIIHVLSTEAQLSKAMHPAELFTVVRTDLEWFGPSIQHHAIKVLLEFLGVPDLWVNFMMRFLQVPMRFTRDAAEEPKVRKCGVPISHPLSTLCGEILLFFMETAVNQQTGLLLSRVHDDFWFWHHKQDKVIKAWQIMQEYATLVGLKFNDKKSGSAVITADAAPGVQAPFGPEGLPQNTVRWGSLVLATDGLFLIDKEEIKPRLEEMKNRLASAKTIMSWINIYNKFMAFFIRGCGKTAKVLGEQHIIKVADTLAWIQRQVFAAHDGQVLAALQSQFPLLQQESIMDMWAFWPLVAGGLGIHNPFLDINAMQDAVGPDEIIDFTDLPQGDEHEWKANEERKANAIKDGKGYSWEAAYKPESFDQYCEKREKSDSNRWYKRYKDLTSLVEPNIPKTIAKDARDQLDAALGKRNTSTATYAQRVIGYYENQLGRTLGTLQLIDLSLIPKTLVDSLRKAKIDWDDE
ncbi:hypothetical protein BZG36_01132 [Bifiguratus adelaidae]|uniref:Reverse transcriptase domain-containing protein n=1 Tax=Bifiguratus adelaidae TaxID=1938954 RepID=A0A261Y666_9FUNG|nr:hypothetical protein BZG36_01132 [Bifiguratus adelaidae]